jgi:magnesium chelatase family protein
MQILSYVGGGYEGDLVRVEVDLRRGIPGIDIVGLPDNAVRESRERVRAAIRNSGFRMPRERILINLAPAGVKKIGTAFDLSIAAAILSGAGQLPEGLGAKLLVVGELGLSGEVRGVPGVLGAIISAREIDTGFFIVPDENITEARLVGNGEVLGLSHLRQLPKIFALLLHGKYAGINPVEITSRNAGRGDQDGTGAAAWTGKVDRAGKSHGAVSLRGAGFWSAGQDPADFSTAEGLDFSDMRGQEKLKRACEIAAAGRHHILFFGPPGAGKTMAALRIPGLLPALEEGEATEVSRIYSIGGKLLKSSSLIKRPPFRVPHHSASREGIIGGGAGVLPGEISYAHKGILFLDEAAQFSTSLLQSLREPIEHGMVRIARSGHHYWYPARFQLILAMNPCPCGKLGQPGAVCMCSPLELHRYWKKLGAAFLDRIDIRFPVEPLGSTENKTENERRPRKQTEGPVSFFEADDTAMLAYRGKGGSSNEMRKRVAVAIEAQRSRFDRTTYRRNAEMEPGEVEKFCSLDLESTRTLKKGISALGLSFRAEHSVLKIARTIADLEGRENISRQHLLEALSLRRYGEGDYFWKKAG